MVAAEVFTLIQVHDKAPNFLFFQTEQQGRALATTDLNR